MSSASFPEIVDPWRMVQAHRVFSGRLPLKTLKRLATSLAASDGEVDYEIDFDKDQFGISGLHLRANVALSLTCQRSLTTFKYPVSIDTRLGFIVNEDDEAGLPEGYEPLLLDPVGLRLADVIEDELILAVPIVPVAPGTQEMHHEWKDERATPVDVQKSNPFAVLKKTNFNR